MMFTQIMLVAALVFSSAVQAHSKNNETHTHSPSSIKGYLCVGTEPFYSLEIKGNKMVYSDAVSEKKTTYKVSRPVDAAGVSSGNAVSYREKNGKAVVTLLSSSMAGSDCSDGMSDNKYAYHMMFVTEKFTHFGCCEPLAQD